MNLDYLNTFIQVVELGSFSEVAKRLSISQPAVSFQVQKLERDLGVRLIDRRQRSISLTDAGKRVLRFARLVAEERRQLAEELDRLREEVTGELVIAASTIPGEILVPPIVGEFRSLHPAVGVRIEVTDSGTVIARVQEGVYDIGFCGVMPEATDLDSFKLAEDEIVLIVFPGHPFAQRAGVLPLDLEGEAVITREEMSGTQQNLKVFMAEAGVDIGRWAPTLVLGSTQAVVAAVEAGVGIAFVSNLAIKKSLALGLVNQVPIEGLKLRRSFYCVYRSERVVSRLLSEFISFCQARAVQS